MLRDFSKHRRPNAKRPIGPNGKVMCTPIETPLGPMTRPQAAACFGIPLGTLGTRIHAKVPMDRLFLPSRTRAPNGSRSGYWYKPRDRPPRYITAWGLIPFKQLAATLRIRSTWTIQQRIRNGWTVEEAFNTPAFGTRGVHFIIPPEEYREKVARYAHLLHKNGRLVYGQGETLTSIKKALEDGGCVHRDTGEGLAGAAAHQARAQEDPGSSEGRRATVSGI